MKAVVSYKSEWIWALGEWERGIYGMGVGDLEKTFINWKAYVISKCNVSGYSKKKV